LGPELESDRSHLGREAAKAVAKQRHRTPMTRSGFECLRLFAQRKELATLWLRWNGEKRAFFEQGFKYALGINEEVPTDDISRQLLLGFALCFDRIKM
jgi:hypothetical protein